jgi:hypothetical protein
MPTSQVIVPSPAASSSAASNSNVVSRKELRRYIAGPWGLGGLHSGIASDGTNLVQGLKQLVDQSSDGLIDTAYDSDRFEHGWLMKLNSDGTSESHRIASYSPNDGTITIGREFVAQPVSGQTEYEIHTHGISPIDINAAIDWACNTARLGAWVMLGGLVADGDMQYSTLESWTTSGATAQKVALVAGGRALSVAASSATGYARSLSFAVSPLKTYRVYAIGTPSTTSGSLSVQAWSDSGQVSVTWFGGSTGTVTGHEGFFGGSFLVPSGTTVMHVRLIGSGTWTGVAVYENMSRGAALPAWCMPYEQVIIGVAYIDGAGGRGTKEYRVIPGLPEPKGGWLEFVPSDWGGPIALNVAIPFVIPSDDSALFQMSARDYIATGALRFIYTGLSRPRTVDTSRYEAGRLKVEREWQAYQRARNPLASKRNSWGKR